MIANFYNWIDENKNDIPDEILRLINKELPKNLAYRKKEGRYQLGLADGYNSAELKLTLDRDSENDAELFKRLESIPVEMQPEYVYRVQKSVPIKDVAVGDDGKKVRLVKAMNDPLSDVEYTLKDMRIYPCGFPDPTPILFETVEGYSAKIFFQQQIHDSVTEIKFSNTNYNVMNIEVYVYNPIADGTSENSITNKDRSLGISYTINPRNAICTNQVLTALYIVRGLLTGTIKVNGQENTIRAGNEDENIEGIDKSLRYWSSIEKIEKTLGVQFNPSVGLHGEEPKALSDLYKCLIEHKPLIWKHPFDHFHIGKARYNHNLEDPEKYIDEETVMEMNFTEGPIACELMGAKFNIYSKTSMKDFAITAIDWDDDDNESGTFYITDAPEKIWTFERMYITEKDANEL